MSKKDFILGFICTNVGMLLYMAYKNDFPIGMTGTMWQHRSHWQDLILCLILTTPVGSVSRPTARKGKLQRRKPERKYHYGRTH